VSERPPEPTYPPREPTPAEGASNTLFGLGLFAISLLLFGGVFAIAFIYLALDWSQLSSSARTSSTPVCQMRSMSSSAWK
jgi:hypothetical protein